MARAAHRGSCEKTVQVIVNQRDMLSRMGEQTPFARVRCSAPRFANLGELAPSAARAKVNSRL
jgi:hypothetical protein